LAPRLMTLDDLELL